MISAIIVAIGSGVLMFSILVLAASFAEDFIVKPIIERIDKLEEANRCKNID